MLKPSCMLNIEGLEQIFGPIKTTTKIHLSLKNPFSHYLFSVHLAWFALRSLWKAFLHSSRQNISFIRKTCFCCQNQYNCQWKFGQKIPASSYQSPEKNNLLIFLTIKHKNCQDKASHDQADFSWFNFGNLLSCLWKCSL